MENETATLGVRGERAKVMRCGVLLSGTGSGMEALVLAQRRGLAHQTVVVVSNKADAFGLQRAEKLNIPSFAIDHKDANGGVREREEHEHDINEILRQYDVDIVVLCGYMRILSPLFVQQWSGKIINIHPSLLPHFPGGHAHRDVLASGATISGCTVHFVDDGMDTGPIIAQSMVPVMPEDDEQRLMERVKVEEHRLYPLVLTWLAEGRIHVTRDGIMVDGRSHRLVN